MLWSEKRTLKEEFKQILFEFNNTLVMLDKESRKPYFNSINNEEFDLKVFLESLRNFLGNGAYREITSNSRSISLLLKYLLVILNSNRPLILTLNFDEKEQINLQTIIIDILNYFAKIFSELKL